MNKTHFVRFYCYPIKKSFDRKYFDSIKSSLNMETIKDFNSVTSKRIQRILEIRELRIRLMRAKRFKK